MIDRKKLKAIAEQATQDPDLWCAIGALDPLIENKDREYIAVANPQVILELLTELETIESNNKECQLNLDD